MSSQTKYTRKFLKKVLRKIVHRGDISFAKARTALKHQRNLVNIDKILKCWRISKYDKDYFGLLSCYFIWIDCSVYVVETQPYFTTSFTCPIETTKAGKAIRDLIVNRASLLDPPLKTNYQATVVDQGNGINVKAVVHLDNYFEMYDETKHGELTK